ncbi:MAG: TonB-dependent receptor, partial [Vicinamibacterales bacterium]
MQAGEGGGASNTAGDMFNLRGFNAANSLFVDGVRDDGLISRDTFNLEQVEVFMGPTGTDVGRGTAAGYVNIETKTPRATAEQSVLVSAGTSDQKRATADLNVPVRVGRSGTWLNQSAFRLNLLWQDGGTPGRDLVRHQGRSVAPSIALGLQTSTRIVASAQVVRQDNLPDYGVPGAAWLESPLAPTTQVAARPVNQRNFYGSAEADYDTAAQNTALARVEHDLTGPVALRNQSRYNKTTREAVISAIQNVAAFTPATNLVTLSRQGNLRENSILSNVSSVVARFMTGRLRHALTAGVEVTKEEQRAPGLTGLGIKAPVDIFVPDPDAPVSGFAPTRSGTYGNGAVDTLAAYGSDAVDVGTRWQLSGALRAERYFARFASLTAAGVQTDERTSDVLLSGKVGTLFTAAYLDSAAHSQNPLNHGRRLPLTPLFSGSLWTTYRLPHGLAVGGGLRHTGPVFVDSANTIRVPGYRLVDLVAEYPVNRMLSLRLNVSNVTDAVYIRNVNNNGGRCLVRDDGARTLLFDLDSAIQQLGAETPDHPVSLQLTGVYHNLLRRWAEA